jgi:hypothetical protein
MTTTLTDAEIDRIADAVPIDPLGVHIKIWHRRFFARAILAARPAPVPADPQAGAVAWGAPSADGKIYIAWHERTDACTIPLYTDPAAPVPVPLGWMPIETAPKDGVIFLIGYTPNSRMDRRVFEARWHDAQQKFTSVNGFLLFDNATHWMPLPPPPGIAAYPEVPK